MAHDAFRFCIPLLILSLLFLLVSYPVASTICFLLCCFICFFFRNPKREIPQGTNLIVSPADGRVVRIFQAPDGTKSISIFLSIFDVHMNRSPISGWLKNLEYRRGKFKAAFQDEASEANEQNVLTIEGQQGITIIVKQIAGLIARRVVCWKQPGDPVDKGELVGLIRFGSRVDIILPKCVQIRVRVGDRVRGGSSVLGELA